MGMDGRGTGADGTGAYVGKGGGACRSKLNFIMDPEGRLSDLSLLYSDRWRRALTHADVVQSGEFRHPQPGFREYETVWLFAPKRPSQKAGRLAISTEHLVGKLATIRRMKSFGWATRLVFGFALMALAGGCQNSAQKVSLPQAISHVQSLTETAKRDVAEVKDGMPAGSKFLEALYKDATAPKDDLEKVRVALARARDRVQDLRVAKSTFFALVDADGAILRSDRVPDVLAGKNLWSAVPSCAEVMKGKTVNVTGSLAEAAGVKGRPDAQWFWLVPVTVDGTVKGAYVTGWSWSAYAYRLENSLRNELKTIARDKQTKEPLAYVYVVVAGAVYGAPLAPEVNAQAIGKQDPLSKAVGDQTWSTIVEITGREFALAVRRAPDLGENVALAVLRSET